MWVARPACHVCGGQAGIWEGFLEGSSGTSAVSPPCAPLPGLCGPGPASEPAWIPLGVDCARALRRRWAAWGAPEQFCPRQGAASLRPALSAACPPAKALSCGRLAQGALMRCTCARTRRGVARLGAGATAFPKQTRLCPCTRPCCRQGLSGELLCSPGPRVAFPSTRALAGGWMWAWPLMRPPLGLGCPREER